MSSDDRAAAAAAPEPATAGSSLPPDATPAARPSNRRRIAIVLVVAVVVLDILAALFVPPYPKNNPGHAITGIGVDQGGQLHLFDGERLTWRAIRIPADPRCRACGSA